MFKSDVSRRAFLRTMGAASVAAGALPAFAADRTTVKPLVGGGPTSFDMGPRLDEQQGMVIISGNENPLGPSAAALAAIAETSKFGGRYHGGITYKTVETMSQVWGLKPEYIGLFPGSGGAVNLALVSHLGPDKPLVHGDPSYEQGPRAAEIAKAPRFPVKLTPKWAHDVKAMLAAHSAPGAYYIVNPNNPTATMTKKEDIVWLLKNKPAGSIVVVDEAYHDFSNDESCVDLVAKDEDIIVTKTFSKIYGMAGIRAGVALCRPDLLAKFSKTDPNARILASISIVSAAAARASLLDKDLVPTRRKINADIRSETLEFLTKKGYSVLPGSQANFFMVDVKRPGAQLAELMRQQNVAIGRSWASIPTYVRVTVGTKDEMSKFQTAFVKSMDIAPTGTANGASLYLPEYQAPNELDRLGTFV